MEGTVDGFRYGAVTPVAAYLMACLGGALGLRCIVRTLLNSQSWKAGWLALGAASIGCGIWTMHFIAMIGFQVVETRIRYDAGLTVLSLAVAIVVVGVGVFIVGHRGASPLNLSFAGVITGLGVAAMHYLGMAALHLNGTVHYDPAVVALSVVIAIVAATAALWAAVTIRGFLTSLGASLIMGIAVTGMHYTGMSAVSVHVHGRTGGPWAGDSPTSLLLPMLLGPAIFLLLAGVVVMFDPLLVLGEGDWNRPSASAARTEAAPGLRFDDQEDQRNQGNDEVRVIHARAPQDPQWAAPHNPRR
ncbi:NO-binding membrane sensor protein with MHYT domain [Streptomyces sp. SAI-208]|uniref:MHYT domain-containing protein n=1 Tax=unclassified Streptomyces TaxID=2593676 RepID=UPI0024744B77|nr:MULTISPECIES: MHYT domain-containing protein [unclassified Streptomyces]MDH6553513.1 NO-binding membrane sensor protein with MHYT domain [Streptomyces sp. SAI-041]MDH6572595.1 NO-binding membrane sensor protein with MHYT domain [Streptomyces sp. SAI-117]MDH6582445.1 NO-binding membrane sensor protein with MHYT domain [Streptomyces sp. SAI-133]MDH6612289.1 NO-binding membrane sensor protein with MHYT domain [Streptomyces sp. SAI-208]